MDSAWHSEMGTDKDKDGFSFPQDSHEENQITYYYKIKLKTFAHKKANDVK